MSDQERGDPGSGALVVREKPPAVKLAANLQVASRHDLVYVDGKGRVRSPLRYRVVQYTWYGLMAGTVAGATTIYYALFGPAGAGIGAAFGLWSAHVLRVNFL